MTKTIVANVHRHQLQQRREVGQMREGGIVNELATDGQSFQRRHPRQRNESRPCEIWTIASPEIFNRLRSTERLEPLGSSDGALAHQHAKLRKRSDVTHRVVVAELVLTAQVSQVR